jgi:hypothetical protein
VFWRCHPHYSELRWSKDEARFPAEVHRGAKLAPFELFPDAICSEFTPTFPLQLQIGVSMNRAVLTRNGHGGGIGTFDFTSDKTFATAYDNNRKLNLR